MVDQPRWHFGQTITGRACEDRACTREHWTLHAEAPLVLTTRPTTAEALRLASEEMRAHEMQVLRTPNPEDPGRLDALHPTPHIPHTSTEEAT